MIKVSVIIPVYNVQAYVEEALQSVLDQTLQDFEIVCVNDRSTDGSWDVVRRMARRDKRIRLFENERNMGAAATRNVGMDIAGGEYLYFLDADDWIVPESLERLYVTAKRYDLDLSALCARFFYEDPVYEQKFGSNPALFKGTYPEVLSGRELYMLWMKYWDWVPAPPRFFYRRRFLQENGVRFPEGLLHEDEMFTFDALMCAQRVHVSKEVLYLRRFRENSATTGTVTAENIRACLRILQHTAASEVIRSSKELKAAADFYRTKITQETRRKYVAAGFSGDFSPDGQAPYLTVIIPVYGVEAYLEECLESVLSQTFTDFEVICVDDASTDRSLDILQKYEKMDPRIRVLTSPQNRGQAAARNRGLDLARGRYVYMMDADDLIEQGTFELFAAWGEEDAPDVAGFENIQFADDPSFEEAARAPLFSYEGLDGVYTGRDAFITLVNRDVLSPSVPTYLFKESFLSQHQIRFAEGLPHEDIGFLLEVLLHADTVMLLHRPFYRRRFRSHSTVTGVFDEKRALGYLNSWKKAYDSLPLIEREHGGDEQYLAAWRKWIRDVLGRIRVLYLESEEENCLGSRVRLLTEDKKTMQADCQTEQDQLQLLWLMLRETTTGRGRAEGILGKKTVMKLEELGEVYVCGSGQYMNRMLDVIGALDVLIKGIIIPPGEAGGRKSLRGFRVVTAQDAAEDPAAVLMAVSHYNQEKYAGLLENAGLKHVLRVSF